MFLCTHLAYEQYCWLKILSIIRFLKLAYYFLLTWGWLNFFQPNNEATLPSLICLTSLAKDDSSWMWSRCDALDYDIVHISPHGHPWSSLALQATIHVFHLFQSSFLWACICTHIITIRTIPIAAKGLTSIKAPPSCRCKLAFNPLVANITSNL